MPRSARFLAHGRKPLLREVGFGITLMMLGACARHALPELEFEDHRGALNEQDAGSSDDDNDDDGKPETPAPEPDPDPSPEPGGDGDGDETPDEEPDVPDDAGSEPEPTSDAGTDPGDLAPHPDNPSNCPSKKPAERGICTTFDTDTCNYGSLSCRCIAVAWICGTIP